MSVICGLNILEVYKKYTYCKSISKNSTSTSFLHNILEFYKTNELTLLNSISGNICIYFLYFIFLKINLFIILLYYIVLVLPYIDLNPPWVYMYSCSWTPLLPPSPSHPSGSSQCTRFCFFIGWLK